MTKWKRECPRCHREIIYKSAPAFYTARKKGGVCKNCAPYVNGFVDRFATKGKNTGSDNAFYGKSHTEESKRKIADRDISIYQTDEFKQKMSDVTSGNKNPMFGRKVYDIWVEKYGQEEADRKMELCKKKHSENNSGDKNPMYGKPTPKGAGNGWKGRYNGFYFRSLLELSYIISVIEPSGLEWKSGETVRIEYEWLGNKRTYRPDFMVGNQLIEVKPEKLINTPNVLAKTRAAEEYCRKHGLSYSIVSVEKLSRKQIDELIESGLVILDERYKQKYKTYGPN